MGTGLYIIVSKHLKTWSLFARQGASCDSLDRNPNTEDCTSSRSTSATYQEAGAVQRVQKPPWWALLGSCATWSDSVRLLLPCVAPSFMIMLPEVQISSGDSSLIHVLTFSGRSIPKSLFVWEHPVQAAPSPQREPGLMAVLCFFVAAEASLVRCRSFPSPDRINHDSTKRTVQYTIYYIVWIHLV